MKTKSLFFGVVTLIVCFFSTISFGQTTVPVGKVNNTTTYSATVTDLEEATRLLRNGLSSNAVISDVYIGYFKEEGNYYLVGNVQNESFSSKGIQLSQSGGVLRSIGGPGIEITCHGHNCGRCVLKFSSWKPFCSCESGRISSDTRCDMSSKVTIGM